MIMLKNARPASPLVLRARTAAELMTPNPVSIHCTASAAEAAAFLIDRGFSAAPVINEAGRPVGVVSRSDVLQHEDGVRGEAGKGATVRDIMTPVVFCVEPDAPAGRVVERMLALGLRRLFVVDGDGVLIGVVSAVDVLRNLCRWDPNRGDWASEPREPWG